MKNLESLQKFIELNQQELTIINGGHVIESHKRDLDSGCTNGVYDSYKQDQRN